MFCHGSWTKIKQFAIQERFNGIEYTLCKEVIIEPKHDEWMDYMSVFAHYLVFKKNSKYICKHCKYII